MNEFIAVVDDEPDILTLVSVHLEKAGYRVTGFQDAGSFMKSLDKQVPDLLILDLMLPDKDGFDVCKELRTDPKFGDLPVIMLTAKGEEFDKVLGLELGADDYITKPFSPRELVARSKAVLRRGARSKTENILRIEPMLTVNLEKREVLVDGKPVPLTMTEFNILVMLVKRRGWVYSREKLLENLWGQDKIVIQRTIDVHIKNLREKLGPAADLIKNVRGVGYKIE